MTARGMSRGLIALASDDGSVRTCRREQAMGALYGDRVLAVPVGDNQAIVKRVLVRAHETMIGVLGVGHRHVSFDPMERHLPRWIDVGEENGALLRASELQESALAQDGDIVRVRVVRWEDEGGLLVRIVERLGSVSQARARLDALVESMRLPARFDADALAQADACKSADLADDPQREDLRALCLFTIDGRDAKDFDDAVSAEPLENGNVRLGVHIADVGHYVPRGTPLDRTALERGTSVYLPGRVLPMLPEQLSNGVCSLRPDEDKFALSAMMEVAPSGQAHSLRVLRTIIRSRARLVYDDVNAMFDGDEEQTARMDALGVRETLMLMRTLARVIRTRREAQGCVDFELDEPVFELDEDGEPLSMALRERGEAERMIEDFMLTANGCVARLARERGLPLLYRVHEKPDPEKLADFARFLDGLGIPSKGLRHGAASPGELRAILESSRERPEYPAIATLALRSMQKAKYDPHPLGHYGLAMADYCHFTSPIRRYPDLVVSRALTAMLAGEKASLTGEALADAAVRSSDRERAAADAERFADKLMAARVMVDHIGEAFDGTVSGVNDFGFYVSLHNGAEGLVPVRAFDEWFVFDERRLTLRGERTGMTFSLGQSVCVRVVDAQLTTGAIDLELCDAPAPAYRSQEKRCGKGKAKRQHKKH